MTITTITRRALTAVVIGAATVSVTACSQPAPTAATSNAPAQAVTLDAATAALVSNPTKGPQDTGKKKDAARNRLARALHATWVSKGKTATVTHQAIRGEVTAVTATSVTVKAVDGFSATYSVAADTKVLVRNLSATDAAGRKPTASTVSALKVGARALVVGVGATSPAANRVMYLNGQRPAKAPKTPKPPKSGTAKPAPTATNPAPKVAS